MAVRDGGIGEMVLLRYGVPALLLLALWLYCVLDVIMTDEALTRNLPKVAWLLIVLLIPDVGAIAWLIAGRPQRAAFAPGATEYRRPPPLRGANPDDDPEFLRTLRADGPTGPARDRERRLREWEEELQRREDKLRNGGGDTGTDGGADGGGSPGGHPSRG